jgi:outer membrane cobalamin receptor
MRRNQPKAPRRKSSVPDTVCERGAARPGVPETGNVIMLAGIPFLFFILLPCLVFAQAPEQQTPDDDTIVIPPVTVRMVRESRDLAEDEAAAGSVLLGEDLNDAGATVPDVVDQEAGVRVTRLGGPASFSTISIRGSTSDQVLVVLDGIQLNSASGGPVDLSRIPLGNVGRIEIYRGASPLQFGSSAIGGVVSVSTRSARTRQLSLSAGGGSFLSREARLFFTEPHEDWELTLGLDYSGWQGAFPFTNDNGTRFKKTDDARQKRQNNNFDQINLLGKGRLRLTDSWSMTALDWFFWRDQGVPGLGRFQTSKSRYSTFDNLTSVGLEGVNLGGMVDWTTRSSFRVAQSTFGDPNNEIGLALDDSSDLTLAPSITSVAVIKPFKWWDITTQAAYRYESFKPGADSLSAGRSKRHGVTAGLESGFLVAPLALRILPSARLQWTDNRFGESGDSSSDTAGLKTAQRLDYSWRGGLVNLSIPDTRVSVSAGRSVRIPSLFELFGNSGRVLGNPALRSESAFSFDAGFVYDPRWMPRRYRLRLELFGFYSQVEDLIQYMQNAQGVARAENIDNARMWGIEAGLRADLFRHLRVHGNYTFLDARNTGSLAARKDNFLPFRPASKWYAKIEGYLTGIPHIKEVALFVNSEWIAGNFLDNANLIVATDRYYLNTGVSIEFRHSKARISITGSNLTNEQTADLTGYPLPGRSVHMFVTAKVL